MTTAFDYNEAFSRTLGWVTAGEAPILRGARIAIAGMGGVGGVHLLTLARLGIGSFTLADFDHFEIQNFNRQVGAMMSTLGKSKCQVLADMARDINPSLDMRLFPDGVNAENVDAFLKDVDVYVDGLDFFVFETRRMLFKACRERGIPAITVAPLGMGAALLNFTPDSMSFDEYFGLDGRSDEEKAIRFLLGLTPHALHRQYLADPSRINLEAKRGPSTPMSCNLCAGILGTEVLKTLLRRGDVIKAPHGIVYDAYRNMVKRSWLPWGASNPLFRLKVRLIKAHLARVKQKNQLSTLT